MNHPAPLEIDALASVDGVARTQTTSLLRDEAVAPARTPITAEASLRMRLLRLPLAVGVVFVHCSGTLFNTAQGPVAMGDVGYLGRLLRDIVSEGMARSSVLVSLLMAGYLLAMGLNGSWRNYTDKLRSKLRTLLLPFLFWNLLVLGLYALAQTLPATAAYMSGRHALISGYSWADFFSAVLGIGRDPIAYQLWFIRDLMLLVVLSPLLLRAIKLGPASVLGLLFVLWLTGLWPLAVPSSRATVFFCVGLHLGSTCKTGAGIFKLDPWAPPMAALYAAMLLINALPASAPWQPYLHELTMALGVPVVLSASQLALKSPALQRRLLRWGAASFFVFAAHEPLLTVAIKLVYSAAAPVGAAAATVLYFLLPLLLIGFLLALHGALAKAFPRFTGWITGGRN
jgi:Acyltransferase family